MVRWAAKIGRALPRFGLERRMGCLIKAIRISKLQTVSAANAAKITDACTLMPADLVKKIVPNADAPIRDQILKRCSESNGTSVLEITLETGIITPTDPVNGAEFVPGLALGGYLERLDPKDRGDTYLTVILGKDPNGLLHVEVAGHDGKDHKDDAIVIARDILAHLK